MAYLRPHDVAVKLVNAWGTFPVHCRGKERSLAEYCISMAFFHIEQLLLTHSS